MKYFANSYTRSGIPDLLVCVNGYFLAIEVKAQTGKPSELQLWHRDQIRKAGGLAVIVYPDQWSELKSLIDDLIDFPHTIDLDDQKIFDKE